MQDSVKYTSEGICKIIIQNANGEAIFVRDMQPAHKKSSPDSSKPQIRDTTQEDLFYQNMHDALNSGYIQELVFKSGNRELTFSRVNDMQIGPEKLKAGSAKCRDTGTSTIRNIMRDLVIPDSEDIICYQILPEDEIPFI